MLALPYDAWWMINKVSAGHEIVLDSPSQTFTIKFESKNNKIYSMLK